MKKTMSRLIALVLALMLVLGATAMASELTSDPFRVSGVKPRPTQLPTETAPDEVEPTQPDAAEPTAEPAQEPAAEPTEAPQPVEPQQPAQPKPQTHTICVVAGCEKANVRSGPGRDFEAIAAVAAGDVVKCFGAEGDWMRIQLSSGVEGYVFTAYLLPVGGESQPAAQPEQPAKPQQSAASEKSVVAPKDVDVRLEADGLSEIFETIPEGAEIVVLAVEGDWVKVSINGQIGYVYIDDLPELLPEQPEEPAQPGELPEDQLPEVEVTLFTSRRTTMTPGETVYLTSKIKNLEYYSESFMQWQVDKGNGFENVPGATSDNYSFEASVETLGYDWQLLVYYR